MVEDRVEWVVDGGWMVSGWWVGVCVCVRGCLLSVKGEFVCVSGPLGRTIGAIQGDP